MQVTMTKLKLPPHLLDLIPAEQMARNEYELVDTYEDDPDDKDKELRRTLRVTTQTLLDRYKQRQEITETQWKAGDTLRADFYLAGMEPRIIGSYQEPSHGKGEITDRQVAARQRFRHAMQAIGPEFSSAVVNVCLLDQSSAISFINRGYAKRRAEIVGMEFLKAGLGRLAKHYGMEE
jgi:hypothetical protein